MTNFWKTAISRVRPGEIIVRGYPIEDLARNCSFGDVVFMLLKGDLPEKNEGKLVEAILVASCEHSLLAPSTDAVRFVASSGVPIQTAVAAGISAVGDIHGGAIEPCAQILQTAVEQAKSAEQTLTDLKAAGKRLPGFGHPLHRQQDPRVAVLLELAEKWNLSGPHTVLAKELEQATEKVFGRRFAMNVDGIIAALMCDMEIDPALGKAFFMVGRSIGYIAHTHEQMTKERPFKAPSYEEIEYTGPDKRDLPKSFND
jgi:citrate synthase